LVKY